MSGLCENSRTIRTTNWLKPVSHPILIPNSPWNSRIGLLKFVRKDPVKYAFGSCSINISNTGSNLSAYSTDTCGVLATQQLLCQMWSRASYRLVSKRQVQDTLIFCSVLSLRGAQGTGWTQKRAWMGYSQREPSREGGAELRWKGALDPIRWECDKRERTE